MSLLNKINCYRRSHKLNHIKEFFNAVNTQRDEIKKIEVRGLVEQRSIGILGEVQKYYSFLNYSALDKEGEPYLRYQHCLGNYSTFLGLSAGKEGSPLLDNTLGSIEKRILKLAKSYNCGDITEVMFAEQMGTSKNK